jgi:hypothetical protein
MNEEPFKSHMICWMDIDSEIPFVKKGNGGVPLTAHVRLDENGKRPDTIHYHGTYTVPFDRYDGDFNAKPKKPPRQQFRPRIR